MSAKSIVIESMACARARNTATYGRTAAPRRTKRQTRSYCNRASATRRAAALPAVDSAAGDAEDEGGGLGGIGGLGGLGGGAGALQLVLDLQLEHGAPLHEVEQPALHSTGVDPAANKPEAVAVPNALSRAVHDALMLQVPPVNAGNAGAVHIDVMAAIGSTSGGLRLHDAAADGGRGRPTRRNRAT